MGTRLFHLATLCVALLLSARADAEDHPWTGDPLSVDKLTKAREALKPRLQQPDKDADDAAKSAFEDARNRDRLLSRLIKILKETESAKAPQDFEAQAKKRQQELAALRKRDPESVTGITGSKQIKPLDEAARTARSERDGQQAKLTAVVTRIKDLDQDRSAIPVRRTKLRTSLERIGDPKAGSSEEFRRDNIVLELRLLKEEESNATSIRAFYSAELTALRAEHDYASEVVRRADDRLAKARKQQQEFATAQAAREKAQAEKDAAQAKLEKDPIYRFRKETNARIDLLQSEIKSAVGNLGELKTRNSKEKRRLERFQRMYDRISRRVEASGSINSETARGLRATLESVESSRETIAAVSSPRTTSEHDAVLRRIGPLQDEEWNLNGSLDEIPEWEKFVKPPHPGKPIPPERFAEAKDVFNDVVLGPEGLRSTLLKLINVLEQQNTEYDRLGETLDAEATALTKVETFIRSHIYWVRTEERLGQQLLESGWSDVKSLIAFYQEPEFLAEFRKSAAGQMGSIVVGTGIFVLLLIASALAGRRLRMKPMCAPVEGKRLSGCSRDVIRMLVHSAAPSLVLLLASAVVERMGVPGRIYSPLSRALDEIALVLFIQRLAWGLLREQGLLITHFDVSPEVAKQVLRSVRIVTISMMVFHVPELALRKAPSEVHALVRLFGTAYRTARMFAIVLLLNRSGPFVAAFVQKSAGGLRLAAFLSPLLILSCIIVVAMDFLGYRDGAQFFNQQILEVFLLTIVLRGIYGGLNQVSDRVVNRVRERAHLEVGGKTASENSKRMSRQLSRVITVLTIVVAASFLASSWGLDATYGSVLRQWKIADLNDGGILNAMDVLKSLGFIVAAHFFSSNLAGLFEMLVFPLFGQIHLGTRYVVVVLTRYAILLIAYSAALISLHFSFASLGWLLAAASVGLGFGLQEIVANFVSGLILLIEQPVRVGDTITVGETGGTVDKITIRSTVVTSWDQKQIIIPNKSFITQNVTNWTKYSNITRRRIDVPVMYGTPADKVLSALAEVATNHESVKSFPAPRIWLDGFGESSVNFVLYVYTDISDGLSTLSELRQSIYEKFAHEGIRIPLPQREIRIKSEPIDGTVELQAPPPSAEEDSADET